MCSRSFFANLLEIFSIELSSIFLHKRRYFLVVLSLSLSMSTWGQTISINPPSNALVQDNSTIAINTLESTPYSIDGLSDSSTYRA